MIPLEFSIVKIFGLLKNQNPVTDSCFTHWDVFRNETYHIFLFFFSSSSSVGFSLLLLFLAVSTICDVLLRYFEGYFSRDSRLATISKFSVYSNALRILSTKSTPQTLPALQGLRFFSMCWVVLGHEYFMIVFAPTINRADFFKVRTFFFFVFDFPTVNKKNVSQSTFQCN